MYLYIVRDCDHVSRQSRTCITKEIVVCRLFLVYNDSGGRAYVSLWGCCVQRCFPLYTVFCSPVLSCQKIDFRYKVLAYIPLIDVGDGIYSGQCSKNMLLYEYSFINI